MLRRVQTSGDRDTKRRREERTDLIGQTRGRHFTKRRKKDGAVFWDSCLGTLGGKRSEEKGKKKKRERGQKWPLGLKKGKKCPDWLEGRKCRRKKGEGNTQDKSSPNVPH